MHNAQQHLVHLKKGVIIFYHVIFYWVYTIKRDVRGSTVVTFCMYLDDMRTLQEHLVVLYIYNVYRYAKNRIMYSEEKLPG